MGLKNIKDFSAEEVGLWLAAGGLGDHASKFVDEGVDGDLLLSLTADDFKNDLGLSGLQSKKVLKNIEFSKNLLEAGGGGEGEGGGEEAEELRAQVAEISGDKDQLKAVVETLTGDKDELQKKVQEMEDVARLRDDEIAALKAQMDEMKIEGEKQQAEAIAHAPAPAPRAAPAPAPAPQSHHHQPRKPRVVGGAARGAAGGAMKGAIAGAILPGMDAGDGAAAGAAVGATTGGLGAIRGRRRMGRR